MTHSNVCLLETATIQNTWHKTTQQLMPFKSFTEQIHLKRRRTFTACA